ncbi:MAG: TatD family hydrolase [Deltaproteobacteria bacterium]|jgi:TatD DNase family protein|nr:TatD family hydrolase [Deltaproteobacteria bacterium]
MDAVDSHCHLFSAEFQDDLPEVLQRARQAGISTLIDVGLDLATSRAALEQARAHPGVHPTAGWHPHAADRLTDGDLEQLVELAAEPEVLAFGEIGLDFFRRPQTRELQVTVFKRLLAAAAEANLPAVLHVREAWPETLEILKKTRAGLSGVLIHCFSGSSAELTSCLELDCHVSFTGALTFPKAQDLRAAAALTPPDRLLVETDAPYLAPAPRRGGRNEPALMLRQLEVLADLFGLSLAEAAALTAANARRFFGLPGEAS